MYAGHQHASLLFSWKPTISYVKIGEFRAIWILFLYSQHRVQWELDIMVAGQAVFLSLTASTRSFPFWSGMPNVSHFHTWCMMQGAVEVAMLALALERDSPGTWQLCMGSFRLPLFELLHVGTFSVRPLCLLCGFNWAQGLMFLFLKSNCAQHKCDCPHW